MVDHGFNMIQMYVPGVMAICEDGYSPTEALELCWTKYLPENSEENEKIQ
jgi:hypothetical protein